METYDFILGFLAFGLVAWWLALAICVFSDQTRKPSARPATEEEKREMLLQQQAPAYQPHWPTWQEVKTSPPLIFTVIFAALIYGTGLIFIWPAFVVLKLWEVTHRGSKNP